MQGRMIFLERKHVVCLLIDDVFCDTFLAPHRINGDDSAGSIELRQQAGNGGDFISFIRYRFGRQHESRFGRKGTEHMHHAIFSTTAAQALAIDGNLMSSQLGQAHLNPTAEGLCKGIAIDSSNDVAERIV